jgi:hypothetical protein
MRKIIFSAGILALSTIIGLAASGSRTALDISELELLASPAFEGRGVGTLGLEKARDLLVDRLKQAGIRPGVGAATEASYLQPFRIFIGNELGAANTFAGSSAADFIPLAFSRSGALREQELVFAGFGITVRQTGDFTYDDYAGTDVQGKIVIVLMGDPGTGNPQSPFRNPAFYTYSTPMYKVQNAELHGAAGIVLIRDPLSLSGAEPPLRFQPRQGGGSSSTILAGQASIQFGQTLLGQNIRVLQEGIARTQRPNSFATGIKASLSVDLKRQLGDVQNVVGLIPGTDPVLANEYIVLGAHYDHLGYGGDSSMDPQGTGKIHPGADDNASGVQAVLHIAQKIQAAGGNRRSLFIVFFSAEEVGLLGSKNFTEALPIPENAKVVAMLNLDMVGRLNNNRLSVLALRSSADFPALVDDVNKEHGFEIVRGDSGFGSSDHASFLQIQVPCLFFTTGTHPDYHRPSDTADKINVDGLERVENFVSALWKRIDSESAPEFDPVGGDPQVPPREGHNYGSYFGSVPEFEQGPIEGVLLQGVHAGSPADLAGLKARDILTGLGEIKVKNLYDMVFALRFYRPNEEIEVRWLRDGQEMRHTTTLRSRDSRAE